MAEPFPSPRRFSRLRKNQALRSLVADVSLRPENLVQPLFVHEGSEPQALKSLPDQHCWDVPSLVKHVKALQALGIPAVALFPKVRPRLKDARGSLAFKQNNFILKTISQLKDSCADLIIFADVALDPYTTHGHDGVLDKDGQVDQEETVKLLQDMALLNAQAGADFISPSDMMDGRVRAIREALDAAGFSKTGILSYAAKFASAYYGPFREAIGSQQSEEVDKSTYQADSAALNLSLLDALTDEDEGADMLLIKPALPCLDLIVRLKSRTLLPLGAYQVSGEYAQIHAAAACGYLPLEKAREESLLAIRRAGANFIFTYFAEAFSRQFS